MPKRLPRTAKPIPDAVESRENLRAVVRAPHDRDFSWILALRLTDGTRIDVFAHAWTRRELLLGDDGAIFRRTPAGRYKQVDPDEELWRLIPHRWEWLEMGGYSSFDIGPEPWPEDYEELGDEELFPGAAYAPRLAS